MTKPHLRTFNLSLIQGHHFCPCLTSAHYQLFKLSFIRLTYMTGHDERIPMCTPISRTHTVKFFYFAKTDEYSAKWHTAYHGMNQIRNLNYLWHFYFIQPAALQIVGIFQLVLLKILKDGYFWRILQTWSCLINHPPHEAWRNAL